MSDDGFGIGYLGHGFLAYRPKGWLWRLPMWAQRAIVVSWNRVVCVTVQGHDWCEYECCVREGITTCVQCGKAKRVEAVRQE